MRFERDRPVLTVDLGALAGNYRQLCQRVAPAEVAGVVKADGYGLGADRIAPALWQAGCRTFFVAYADEAVALRAILPEAVIFVLAGVPSGAEEEYLARRLTPVLNSLDAVAAWRRRAADQGKKLPAAVHIDTGMCRLGVQYTDLARLGGDALDGFDPCLVMSHLACADEADNTLNGVQLERFIAARTAVPGGAASLANSSGIFLGGAYHFDLCRPGIALYGVNPTPPEPNPMEPVVSLHAPVLQVHDITEPGSVGYGATHATRAGERIATLPLGYADGMLMRASNRAVARVGDVTVPLVGRISMDLITIDVSGLPPSAVVPGTPVELIGGADGLDDYAAAAGSIGYELLTRLGHRFERRYVGGPAA